MKFQLIIGLALVLMLGLAWPAQADWQGRVIKVHGGGDILVLHTDDNRNLTVRLYGLDCPEPDQPFGHAAGSMTEALVIESGRPVTVLEERRDFSGQMLVTVVLYDGTTLNDRLLLAGLAWIYPKHCVNAQGCQNLLRLQERAKLERRGLWSQENPIPPWQWQGQKR